MNKLSLLILSFFLTGITHAQDNSNSFKRHEIGVNLFSYANVPMNSDDVHLSWTGLSRESYINAVMYKFHFRHSALRVSFHYQKEVFPEWNSENPIENQFYNGSTLCKELRFGYQRNLGNKKLVPYWAVEATYSTGKNDGQRYNSYGPLIDPQVPISYTKFSTVALVPSLGVSYFLNKWMSLRLETSASIGSFHMEEVYENPLSPNVPKSGDGGALLMYNPISALSVNVHF